MIGGLSLLERRAGLNGEQRRILGMTRRAAEQGSELVRRLLAFARRQKLEPQRIDHRIAQGGGVGPADPHARRHGPDRVADRTRGVGRLRRPVPARARAGQFDHQRPRRDAVGRDGDDRRRHASCRGGRGSRARRRRLRAGDGGRHRHRHPPRGPRQGDGAVLHHQGDRQGQRPRLEHGLWVRQAVQRPVPARQQRRRGHDRRAVAAPRA